MEDSPRYRIVTIGTINIERELRRSLRPGDRIVSVFPARVAHHANIENVYLSALIELRHPSWKAERVGWVAGEEEDDY